MDDGTTETSTLRAEFSPGKGRLGVFGDRFVFVGENGDFLDGLNGLNGLGQSRTSNRDFFRACIELWFSAGTTANLVAGVCAADHTAVFAVGHLGVTVSTEAESGELDPAVASFAAERVFRGALREITFRRGVQPMTCWATEGLVPADSFRVSSVRAFRGTSCVDPDLGESQIPATQGASPWSTDVDSDAALESHPLAGDDLLAGSEAAAIDSVPTTVRPTAVFDDPILDPFPEVDEDLIDGATVWPAQRLATPPAFARTPLDAANALQEAQPPRHFDVIADESANDELSSSAQEEGLSDWEPPAPFIPVIPENVGTPERTPIVSTPIEPQGRPEALVETVNWIDVPSSSSTRSLVGDAFDETEMTIMAGDLERLRRSFVELAPTASSVPDVDAVLGAYCVSGHFTDVKKPRCLFCGGEVDFDSTTTGSRPLLGSLVFDDGQVVELAGCVVIGRNPTHPGNARLVAFDDDKLLSRTHLEVRLVDWGVVVVDRQSVNGTSIQHEDGRRISSRANIESPLSDGTVVEFGNHSFTYRRTA